MPEKPRYGKHSRCGEGALTKVPAIPKACPHLCPNLRRIWLSMAAVGQQSSLRLCFF
jgi:hypothetical protein